MLRVRLLLLLALLAGLCSGQTSNMEAGLLRFFEQFRCRMIYEQENIKIPRLEPFEEEEMSFEFDQENFGSIKMLLKNVRVEGLSDFHVPNDTINFDVWTLNFFLPLELPKLTVTGWYSLEGDLDDLMELTGSGDFSFVIENLKMSMDGNIGYEATEHTWWMNRLDMDFELGQMTGFMKGIMNDEVLEDFLTYLLNNATPRLVQALWPDLEPEIVKVASEMTPELLNGTELLELINIIFLDVEFLMELPEGECPIEPLTM